MSIADKLTTIAENQQKVYDAGVLAGQKSGGYSEGQQAEHKRFWDSYQENGTLSNYNHAFAGRGWHNDIFKPYYTIAPKQAYMMFRESNIEGDLVELLNASNTSLDTSALANSQYMFSKTKFTRLGEIDLRKDTVGYYTFQESTKLHTIDKVIFSSSTPTYQAFYYCYELTNITVEGTIAANLSFIHSSKLTNESVQSIIDHLADRTGSTQLTLTLHANVGGSLTEEQKLTITAKNWALVY